MATPCADVPALAPGLLSWCAAHGRALAVCRAIAEEREACAKVADGFPANFMSLSPRRLTVSEAEEMAGEAIAAAIRARG
jgi:hypothetical protein